jgi:uridylate kinase
MRLSLTVSACTSYSLKAYGSTIPILSLALIVRAHAGAITTLGRGGSDLTATFFGAALCLREVTVWKDVDGVLTSDPRLVRDARVIDLLTYDEATELAYFGAQARSSAVQLDASGAQLNARAGASSSCWHVARRPSASTVASRGEHHSLRTVCLCVDVLLTETAGS